MTRWGIFPMPGWGIFPMSGGGKMGLDFFGSQVDIVVTRANGLPITLRGYDMKIELKKVKIIKSMSRETTCFQADLWIDGKKAADIHNDGHGGCNFYHFQDKDLEQRFFAHCKSLPPIPAEEQFKSIFPNGLPMDEDILIGELLNKHEQVQNLKRMTKTKTLVKLADHKFGEWTIYKLVYTPQIGQELRKKHGADLVAIANEDLEKAAGL